MYPNSLLLGRPALVNPRDRLAGIGKLRSLEEEPRVAGDS